MLTSVGLTPKDSYSKPSNFFHSMPKLLNNIFNLDEKNQINELISSILELKNLQNFLSRETIPKSDLLKLLKICNKLLMGLYQESDKQTLDILEFEKFLLILLEGTDDSNNNDIQISALNNCAIGSLIKKDTNFSQILNNLLNCLPQLPNTNNQVLIGITYNNLSSYSLMQKDYLEAYKYSEKGLTFMESYIFKKIHHNKIEDFSKNSQFLQELIVLLAAYMNFGYSLRYFQNNLDTTPKLNLPSKRYQTFFANGYKLGMKYLGSKNLLTYKLNVLCRSKTIETVPEMITTDEEKPRKPLKKVFNNEISYNRSEYESSNDDFQINNPKSFRINSKQNILRKPSENLNNSSKYFTQIKEMEETLSDIKQMREFYEREKRLLEEQQQMKKMDLLNNGLNFYGVSANNVHSPHESQIPMGTWMNNYMNPMNNPMNSQINQMNLMNNPMNIPMNNQVNNPMNLMNNNQFYGNNGQFYGNDGQFNGYMNSIGHFNNNQRLEQMDTKQQELEDQLMKIKRENDEILKDKEKKQNELLLLKKTIEELKNTRKIPEKNNEDSNQNIVNSNKSSPDNVKNSERINEDISPCSSSKNIEEIQQIINKTDSPELLDKYKGKTSPGKYVNKEERNFRLSLSNLKSEEKNNEQLMGIPKEKKNVNSQKEVIFRKEETFGKIAAKANFQPQIINKIELNSQKNSKFKNDKNEKNDKNINKNDQNDQNDQNLKNDKNITNKLAISEKSLPPNKTTQHRKSERKNRISSIDFLSATTNPGILLKNLTPNFPRNFPVKKQLVFNEILFSIECRIIDEKELAYFLLQGKNETEQIELKEEKLPIHLFSKILQTVDVKDVLPYEVPIRTIEAYEDFMIYCVMPFLGIGFNPIDNNRQIIEVWPKAHGLFLNLITADFLSEECFLFFHHITRDQFRLVLAHSQSGKNVRIDFQLDQTSIDKLFEMRGSKGGKRQEIDDILTVMKSSKESKILLEKLKNIKPESSILQEIYKIIDLKTLLSNIELLLKEFEKFLKGGPGIKTFFELMEEELPMILKIKVWSSFNRFRMQFLRQSPDGLNMEIFMKNGFETHAPEKQKVKSEGKTTYSFENFWKHFGVPYKKMELNDKLILSSLILDAFTLEIFEKELDIDDYDRYEENPISQINMENCGFLRVFIGDTYKIPLTITLLGIENIPIGVKITIYDMNLKTENGVFLTINADLWKKDEKEKEKKKKKKYMVMTPMEENYDIAGFLKENGFNLINNLLVIEKKGQNYEITGKRMMKNMAFCDNIESMLSFQSVLGYLNKQSK